MYIRVNVTKNSPRKSVQIVEGNRDQQTGKVKTKIIRHMGIAMNDEELIQLKQMAAAECVKLEQATDKQLRLPLNVPDDTEVRIEEKKLGRPSKKKLEDIAPPSDVKLSDLVEEKRINEGINDIAGQMFNDLGFDSLLKSKKDTDLLKHLVLARFIAPQSKEKTCRWLQEHEDKHYDSDQVYLLMDKIFKHIPSIKKMVYLQTKNLIPEQQIDILFFDVTTLYFESVEADELREKGFSKDHKHHQTQVVLALATNKEGLPIGYELFPGNTAEITTLIRSIGKWRVDFKIEKICFVADRGLFSEENLTLLEEQKFEYVIGCPLRKLSQELQNQILYKNDYKVGTIGQDALLTKNIVLPVVSSKKPSAKSQEHTSEIITVTSLQDAGETAVILKPERTIVASFSEKRAIKDAKERQKLLDKLAKKIGKKGRTKNLVSNTGFLKLVTENNTSTVSLDPGKIEKDALWDGMHGIITNKKDPNALDLIARYRGLWVIEESFRINKHNLQMRPIYHHKKERIEAHIALCYMTFALARHLQYRVKLRQIEMSLDTIRETLMSVQASILIHTTTKERYKIPSATSHNASKLYKVFDLKRSQNPSVYL
jgi:transposase